MANLPQDRTGTVLQVMQLGTIDAHAGGALDVSSYVLIVFDADVTLTYGGNSMTWAAYKELGVKGIDSITVTAANYMAL